MRSSLENRFFRQIGETEPTAVRPAIPAMLQGMICVQSPSGFPLQGHVASALHPVYGLAYEMARLAAATPLHRPYRPCWN